MSSELSVVLTALIDQHRVDQATERDLSFDQQLAALVQGCTREAPAGVRETCVDGVRVFWTTLPTPPAPLIYEPGIVVLLQGSKVGTLGERTFIYDAENYLVLTLSLPFRCAHQASSERPLCGFFIGVDREDLASLLAQMADFNVVPADPGGIAVAPAPVDAGMRSAIHRLVAAINDPLVGKVLGRSLCSEILFHALRGPRGPALAGLTQQHGEQARMDSLIRAIRRDVAQPFSVEAFALRAGMSLSSFHRAFREKTGQSPLQYVKQLRLHAARDMITFKGMKVSEAARQVGYESGSQFSREYRRYFGESATETRGFARLS
jgi:AraC-like DNA-binding protein